MQKLFKFFHPKELYTLCETCRPFLGYICFVLFAAGLYLAWHTPLDYQHGSTIRILYIHVPASWMALFIFAAMGMCALIFLVGKIPTAPFIMKALCPAGLVFTALSLITGSLWGRPAWGTWWVWDARLSSMALLFLQYWGCFIIYRVRVQKSFYLSSLFVLVGLINLPIIKWSVTWWSTLHQPASLMKWSGPSIHSSFMPPLLCMALASLVYTLWIVTLRLPVELSRVRFEARHKTFRLSSGKHHE